VTTDVRSGIGLIELLDWRLQWIVVLSAYKTGTNDEKPAGQDAGQNGFIQRRDESH
jgi:hypothetical protein